MSPEPMRGGNATDAVVVLGAQVLGPDEPSPAVARRLAHGVEVLGRLGARRLVLAGGVGKAGISEAAVMARRATALGVAAERLVLEERSTNTLEQAVAVTRLARQEGWRRVVVVTDRYHLPRARFLFRRMGLPVAGEPAPGPVGGDLWRWLGGAAREVAAWAKVGGQALGGGLRRAAAAAREVGATGTFPGSCG
jgi:uncharacterized SAM-binding protein YcdF (DUF218 family)